MRVLLLGALSLLGACSTLPPTPGETPPGWRLTFSDEFDGEGRPDPSKWISQAYNRRPNPDGPDGWWDEEAVSLDGEGRLVITVRRVPDRNGDGDPYDFATGMVSTEGLFTQAYGRYEVRAMTPREPGWWAAFWLFGDTVTNVDGSGEDGSEIDIMEVWGATDRMQHAVHWDGYEEAHRMAERKLTVPGLADGFHTYALEWTPDTYVFFVDGAETWRTRAGGVATAPNWVKLTGELSTEDWALSADWAGDLDPDAFPDRFVVDWVRVYERAE